MAIELLLFTIVATLVTFAVVTKFATNVPNPQKPSIKRGAWGAYPDTSATPPLPAQRR
ncbi:MAG TPA: hypothetical protein V6C97_04430 [Oculatellaceae cyanobacterium]